MSAIIFFILYFSIIFAGGTILWFTNKNLLYKIINFINKYSIINPKLFGEKIGQKQEIDEVNTLSVSQSMKILGFKKKPKDIQEIKKKFNHLIKANHPDRGGSDYLSDQITKAKNTLIDNMNKK